jgi:hypothetical protein
MLIKWDFMEKKLNKFPQEHDEQKRIVSVLVLVVKEFCDFRQFRPDAK